MIRIFNRSHYEDIIVTRVHKWIDDHMAKKRMKAINDFEELLQEHNNTTILKFYLHVSHEEQLQRLNERIHNPRKQWKYNEKDFVNPGFGIFIWKYTKTVLNIVIMFRGPLFLPTKTGTRNMWSLPQS